VATNVVVQTHITQNVDTKQYQNGCINMDVATHTHTTHLWCMDTCSTHNQVTCVSIHHTCVWFGQCWNRCLVLLLCWNVIVRNRTTILFYHTIRLECGPIGSALSSNPTAASPMNLTRVSHDRVTNEPNTRNSTVCYMWMYILMECDTTCYIATMCC
jgi:hypothetical protein